MTSAVAAVIDSQERSALDVLFVVDQSMSMLDEQVTLGARAREALFEAVAQHAGLRPDLHIGVITTSVYADLLGLCNGPGPALDGALVNPGCTSDGAAFLRDLRADDGRRTQNYADFDEAFACSVNVGPDGCGIERPFDALSRALARPDNAAFFRADADLLVIVLTDEDDCSASPGFYGSLGERPSPGFACQEAAITCNEELREPGNKTSCVLVEPSPLVAPQAIVDELVAFKGNAARVAVTVISGGTDTVEVMRSPSGELWAEACSPVEGAAASAAPAFRMAAFAAGFPGRAETHSICAPLDSALRKTASLAGDALARRGCLRGAFSTVAHPRCKAIEIAPGGAQRQVAMRLEPDALCGTASGLRAVITQGDLARDGHVEVRCDVAVAP